MSLKAEPLPEQVTPARIKVEDLRQAISREYEEVAKTPKRGFHFHTGRRLMHRVLGQGGRLQIADIIVQKQVPESAKRNIDLWTGGIAGALLEEELATLVTACGFKDFAITWCKDVFKDAPQAGSAANFGTLGINFKATK